METFAHGAVQLRTFVIPDRWRQADVCLADLSIPEGMMVGLISRKGGSGVERSRLIFPHGDDTILPGDEVTVIGETDVVADIHLLFGSRQARAESVVIVGGTAVSVHLARILEEQEIHVRIIDKDRSRCDWLSRELPRGTIIHHDGTDFSALQSEKVDRSDLLVACTDSDESNLTIALMAKEVGCKRVVALLTDARLVGLAKKNDIDYTASPRVSAANRILSLVHGGTVSSMVSLYEHQAEIVELRVSADSKVVGIPIAELGPQFPKDFLLSVIQNRGRILVANGNRVLSPGDTVIVVTNPQHLPNLEKVF